MRLDAFRVGRHLMKRPQSVLLNHAFSSTRRDKAGYVLLGAGAAAVISLFISIQHIQADMQVLSMDRANLSRPSVTRLKSSIKETVGKSEEITAVKAAMGELSRPWEVLFTTLENVQISQVTLLSVEPIPKQKRLRISAAAADFNSMLEYVSALGRQPILKDVFLLEHEYGSDGSPTPIRFVVEAIWLI